MHDYAKFFGAAIREKGIPNVSQYEFTRMMNIVYLNGKLDGVNVIREKLKGTKDAHRYDMDAFRVGKKLTELTGAVKPSELLRQMIMDEPF